MSKSKKINVTCSKCGAQISATVFESINSDYTQDLSRQITSGALFEVQCPCCKAISRLEYDILYHDMRHGAMIWVIHKDSPTYSQKLREVHSLKKPPYKTLRIVNSINSLREKVFCMEHNRDDRIIELCKVLAVNKCILEQPRFQFDAVYYTVVDGREFFSILGKEKRQFQEAFSEEIYGSFVDLLNRDSTEKTPDDFMIIDYAWAESKITQLMGAVSEDSADYNQAGERKEAKKVQQEVHLLQRVAGEVHLSKAEMMEIPDDLPVLIEYADVFCTEDREKFFLRCRFKSLSDKEISALMVDIFCFDVWGKELTPIEDVQILDLSAQRGEEFGYSQKIVLADINTRSVKVVLKRIKFANGMIVECNGESVSIPKAMPLGEYFASEELAQRYIRAVSPKAYAVPRWLGKYWMCACGELNTAEQEICIQCKAWKHTVFSALDPEYLSEMNVTDAAQVQPGKGEIQSIPAGNVQRKSGKKRKIKIAVILLLLACLAAAIAIGVRHTKYCEELRNFATDPMEACFTNVYANVVKVEPKYFVYRYATSRYGTKSENGTLWEVVCRCKTSEGRTIWASFFYQDYPGGDYSDNESDYRALAYNLEMPLRIFGKVDSANQIADGLKEKIGDIYVLCVKDAVQQK